MSRRLLQLVPSLFFLLAGCSTGPRKAPALTDAYVAPASLPLRKELALNSPAVATAKHGDRVEVIQTRRKFILVRTAAGVEGWTDNRQLITPAQMAAVKAMASLVRSLSSYGKANAVAVLNGHTEPNRQSPGIFQLAEKTQVEVVARRVTPRNAAPSVGPLVVTAPPKPARKKKDKKEVAGSRLPPPPMPRAPAPPEDWLELSQSDEPEDAKPEPVSEKPAKPVPLDEWALVRTADGRAGWVLGRMLSMAIPDEVAQYSEGARITSYHSLGQAHDGGEVKDHWIWTTQSQGPRSYDFNAYRVFIWSVRHHRYETAFVERRVEGFLPVTVEEIDVPSGKTTAKARGFSVLLREDDGQIYKKTYWFEPWKVRLMSEEKAVLPPDPLALQAPADGRPAGAPAPASDAPPAQSWWSGVTERIRNLGSRGH